MNLKIELNKNKTQAHVYLELPKRGKNGNWTYVKYNTSDATNWVTEQGYKIKSCIKATTVDNATLETSKGTWIFELEVVKQTPNKRKPTRKILEVRVDEPATKQTTTKTKKSRKKPARKV